MSDYLLEVRNISKSFVGVKALDDVSLAIQKGEIHCLIGENGSGKSTLIKIIGGVYTADTGTVAIDGQQLHGSNAIESIRAGVQIIYQDLSLYPNLTVAENISINQLVEKNQKTVNWKQVRETAARTLEEIGESDIPLNEYVENLSMASRQIIAISRALTQNARLIIMDEATSAITKEEVDHLFTIIDKLQKRGISILFVSHKLSEVMEISDSISVLRDGKMVGVFPKKELTQEKLIFHMTGRKLEYSPYTYNTDQAGDVPVLEVKGLSKRLQYQNISFTLRRGEILGITGLIGSGRTEVVQSLFGLNKPDEGEIIIEGTPADIKKPGDAIRHGIALLPEDRLGQGIFAVQPIRDNIITSIIKRFQKKSMLLDNRARKQAGDQWIKKLKIKTPNGANPANSLSGGNQQRVVLAKWLATDPKVFILDGPTIGIDIGSKHTIHEIIRDLAEQGMSFIMISDEIEEVLENCNRVLLMSKGHIIKEVTDVTSTNSDELYDVITAEVEV